MASSTARITSLDHLVLTVANVDATVAWYAKHLGMKHEAFVSPKDPSVTRHALLFGSQKINLHKAGAEFEPKAGRVMPGSGDLCFLSETRVEDVLQGLRKEGVEVLEEGKIVDRTGARGQLRSVYVRDPDGNLIEFVLGSCILEDWANDLPESQTMLRLRIWVSTADKKLEGGHVISLKPLQVQWRDNVNIIDIRLCSHFGSTA
jgi:catechol 2,3-dioxygenase-like lactoylglutathione lyase family enzyme